MKDEATKQVIQSGIDDIDSFKGQNIEASELHHHLYNEDYFIIGYYNAEQFLNKYGVFAAIEKIKQYEQDNFGEVNTDFSDSEKVANMFAYIVGEEGLNDCKTLSDNWDKKLTDKQLDKIKKELEAQL
jgi:hypothetical protein